MYSAEHTVEKLQFLGAAIAFFAAGALVYENFRIKVGRPILNGSAAVQLYYVSYLTMFVLSAAIAVAAIVR